MRLFSYACIVTMLVALVGTTKANAASSCGSADSIISQIVASKFQPFAQFESMDGGGRVTVFRDERGNVIVTGTFVEQAKVCIFDTGRGLKLALPEYDKKDTIVDPRKTGSPS